MEPAGRRQAPDQQGRGLYVGRQARESSAPDPDREVVADMGLQVAAHERRRGRMKRDPGRLDPAGREDEGGIGPDTQELTAAVHVDFERVDCASALVEADHMGPWHQKQTPIGIVAAGVGEILANGADQAGMTLYLSKLNGPDAGALA